MEYKAAIGLPEDYCFLYGNPVQVLVPVETATDGLMVVGAYPSAKFHAVQGISDIRSRITMHHSRAKYTSAGSGSDRFHPGRS